MKISALGSQVEPIIGYRGIRGANRYTAEELGLIANGRRRLTIETRYADGEIVYGSAVPGVRTFIPERILQPNGRINFLGLTNRKYLTELLVSTHANRSGLRTTSILIDEQQRFKIVYEIQNGELNLRDVASVGSHHYLASRLRPSRRKTTTKHNGQQLAFAAIEDAQPPVALKKWQEYDSEGRWLLYLDAVKTNPDKRGDWLAFLVQQREFQLLEWLALYEPDAFKTHGVGDLLEKNSAPQWLRVAVWHVTAPYATVSGHSRQTANDIVVNQRPGTALDWLLHHRKNIENWKSGVDSCLKELLKPEKGTIRRDSKRLLPPLKAADVFQHLDPEISVESFGDSRKAQEGVVYEHQVIRAINGVTVNSLGDEKLIQKVRAMTQHGNVNIRHAALLAMTYFIPKTSPLDKLEDLQAFVQDTRQPAKVREAALMAISYHKHPSVLLQLHKIAMDPNHVCWGAAVSRIGDLAQPFSVELLQQVPTENLSAESVQLLTKVLSSLKKANANKVAAISAVKIKSAIEYAAYGTVADSEYLPTLKNWAMAASARLNAKARGGFATWSLPEKQELWLPTDYAAFSAAWAEIHKAAVQVPQASGPAKNKNP